MGWYFGYSSRKDIVDELTAPYENDKSVFKVLKHCLRGNVLWTVNERTIKEIGETERWIGCTLLEVHGGEWGYKPMEEAMHPFYYTCPLSYLDMAPVASDEWRAKVREYWKKRRAA